MNLYSLSGRVATGGSASPSPAEAIEVVEVVMPCSGVVVADSSSMSQVSTPVKGVHSVMGAVMTKVQFPDRHSDVGPAHLLATAQLNEGQFPQLCADDGQRRITHHRLPPEKHQASTHQTREEGRARLPLGGSTSTSSVLKRWSRVPEGSRWPLIGTTNSVPSSPVSTVLVKALCCTKNYN
ncbi:hypothetical protein E2C01_003850 [Portunus trituberculatus]|uniref:Uncharacterized protein n=1 Tax=Portunus trituberculatus TaxID=210409 RepID=A0A5B7CNY4_PORTR|nr:hypothetical protein [Portunus trituberculatus]